MGGHLHVLFNVARPTIPQIKAGKVRALATTGAARFEALPEVPTIAEAGVPGYEYNSWNAVFVLRGTPRPVINTAFGAIQKALADPELRKLYAAQGLSPAKNESPQAFDKFFRADYDRIVKIVQAAGIKPE